MQKSFYTIMNETIEELIEKKSRFIAYIFYVKNENDVNEKIKEIKKLNKDAKHNVFAYRLENGIEKYSEDGEPQRNSRNTNFRYAAK